MWLPHHGKIFWGQCSTLPEDPKREVGGSLHFCSFGSKISKRNPPLMEILTGSFLGPKLKGDHKSNLFCAKIVGDAWSEVAECVAKGWAYG